MLPKVSLRRSGLPAYLFSFALLGLTGCISGGGSGGSAATTSERPAPAPLGVSKNLQGNAEFERNDGVDIINAEAAYLRGASGAGVNVAVIDTGIDADHPDLDGNISAASRNIVSDNKDLTDGSGHGTKSAGVIAAELNGQGTHGVAYDANILAIKAARCDASGCLFHFGDLTKAVNYATDNLAHIINMSLGGASGGDSALNAAISRAANAGVYVVISTGNSAEDQPFYPSNLAGSEALTGKVIAVGAVTDSGGLASFSNKCGAAMDSCIMAPGVSIATTKDGATSATDITYASGTSFAAPHVSGALALLVQLYPDAYAADPTAVAMFMFDGARDLGVAGVDEVYGHGLLDVAGAIKVADNAIAAASLSLSEAGTVSLSDSLMTLSPAFGDALESLDLLDSAVATISLSDGEHPYQARLGDRISRTAGFTGLEQLLADSTMNGFSQPLGDVTVSLALAEGEASPLDASAEEPEDELLGLQFATSLDNATDARLGIDISAAAQLGSNAASRADSLFLSSGSMMNPVSQIAGRGNALSLNRSVGKATTLSLGLFEGAASNPGDDSEARTRLGQASLSHGFGNGATLRVDAGMLTESAALLGSQGSGAFDTGAGAATRYVTASGGIALGQDFDLLGSATLAAADMGEFTGSAFKDWSDIRANAFGIGIAAKGILGQGDRLGVLVGQPLRVYEASATLTLPVGLDENGQPIMQSERAKLTPSGRQIDLQIAYDRPLAPGMAMSSWVAVQRQPGHDADAGNGMAAGLRFDVAF
jgi:hypothetical protein